MNKFLFIIFLAMLSCKRYSEHCNSIKEVDGTDSLYIENSEYDFGVISDTVTQLSKSFKIINNTRQSQKIKRIETSCGCTNVSISDSIIRPHSYSFIKVNVDISSNYNYFERDISVYFHNHSHPKSIYIRASRELPKHLIKKEFPVKLGDSLRLNIPYLILGNIQHGEAKSGFINIINTSNREVHFVANLDNPNDSIFSVFYDDCIQPSDIGKIIVMADLSNVHSLWGRYKLNLILSSKNKTITIPIEAIFTTPFPKEAETKPKIMTPIDHYTISDQSRPDNVVFNICNIGNADLRIFCIRTTYNINFTLSATTIKPQRSTSLSFNRNDLINKDIEIEINTNDPSEPLKILRISKE